MTRLLLARLFVGGRIVATLREVLRSLWDNVFFCFFGTTVLSFGRTVLLSTSTYFLHSVSVALTNTLLAGFSLLGFFGALYGGPS